MSQPQIQNTTSAETTSSSPTVIIVDDDPHLVEALLSMLREEGYGAEGFTDPAFALERIRSGPPASLILADCVMPRMSGGELLDALAQEGIATPVVLMTALSDPNFCVTPGRATVLSKPFQLEDLLAEIDAQLGAEIRLAAPAAAAATH